MLRAVGTKLYDGDKEIRLNGINDTTVLTFQMLDIYNAYPSVDWAAFRFSNHNLPQYPVPGSTYSDRDCKIPSSSWKEFWYKYFWLLRNALGGSTASTGNSKVEGHQESGNTYLNHLRIGGHNEWGGDPMYLAFKNTRAKCDQTMNDILNMAAANGIYLNITMSGGPSSNGTYGVGDVFTVGTVAYNTYVQYCADFISAYGNHSAIAVFDLSNEPINYTKYYPDGIWRSEWWVNKYGMDKVQYTGLSQPYEKWEAEAIKWKQTLLGDVRSKITLNPKPLLTIGGGYYFVNYWDSQVSQDIQKKRAQDYLVNDDFIIGHPYGSAEDDYLINWNKTTRDFLGKPAYEEEYGYNRTTTKPDNSYWPWRDLKNAQIANNCCVMVLNGMPNPVFPPQSDGSPDHYCWPQPDYPGYPLSTIKLTEATNAWIEFNSTPIPEPEPEPEPPQPPTETITIDIPAYDQGSITIPSQVININLPAVVIPAYSGNTDTMIITQALPNIVIPAKSIVVNQRIHGFTHNFTVNIPSQTIIQGNLKITIPGLAVRIPSQTVTQGPVLATVASQSVKLPAIDLPPVTVEVPE